MLASRAALHGAGFVSLKSAVSSGQRRRICSMASRGLSSTKASYTVYNENELKLTNTTMQRLEVYLRWLFVQYGFQVEPLKQAQTHQDALGALIFSR